MIYTIKQKRRWLNGNGIYIYLHGESIRISVIRTRGVECVCITSMNGGGVFLLFH